VSCICLSLPSDKFGFLLSWPFDATITTHKLNYCGMCLWLFFLYSFSKWHFFVLFANIIPYLCSLYFRLLVPRLRGVMEAKGTSS
jgi:hypothetical protein